MLSSQNDLLEILNKKIKFKLKNSENYTLKSLHSKIL